MTEIGHNNPPAFNPEALDELSAKAADIADAAAEWKEAGEITTKEQAEKLNDFLAGARKTISAIEDKRKAEKAPYLEAGRKVDEAFGKQREIVERAGKLVKPLLEMFLRAQEEKERKRKAEEARKAQQQAEEAERERRQAEARNDLVGQKDAEEKAKAAAEAAAEAQRNESAKVDSATGGGKRTALRTNRWVEIVSINQAMLHYRDNPEMSSFLIRLGNADLRAAKGKEIALPGFEIKVERKL